MKERVEQVADARTGVAVELERMILDALGAESGDDDDVLDAIGDERRDLPADEAAAVELDQAFGDVAGQRQQARALPGRQDGGLGDGPRGWIGRASGRERVCKEG